MSYIEEKYAEKILKILDNLSSVDQDIRELLEDKTIKHSDKIATLCAQCNKDLNLILKKYYPEIKSLDYKLQIKSRMKFYFELIDKLTDFIRNVEAYQKLDDKYYELIIDFIRNKESLISEKFTDICSQELIVFYDKTTRANLEDILEKKLMTHDRKFFTLGPLEEEIKKIGISAGANSIVLKTVDETHRKILVSAESIILFSEGLEGKIEELHKIGSEIKGYLESKKFEVVIELGLIITNAKLLSD